MSGAGIRITPVGFDEASAALRRAVEAIDRPRELYDEIGGELAGSTRRRFDVGRGPDNSPWPPSIRVRFGGGKTLVDTGRLLDTITHNATDTEVEIGTNVLYAAIHQFGGTIRPKSAPKLRFRLLGDWKSVDEVTIPARPFLGIDDEDERNILAIAGDWLARATGAAGEGTTP